MNSFWVESAEDVQVKHLSYVDGRA
jgi:hypothetical protein